MDVECEKILSFLESNKEHGKENEYKEAIEALCSLQARKDTGPPSPKYYKYLVSFCGAHASHDQDQKYGGPTRTDKEHMMFTADQADEIADRLLGVRATEFRRFATLRRTQ